MGAYTAIILRVCVCMHHCIYLDFTYPFVAIRCPAEASCLWGSPTFPVGWSFWDKQASLLKDSWAKKPFLVNSTGNWNQSAGLRGSDKLLLVCRPTPVAGKVGAFLSKVNQWFTSTVRPAVIDPRLSALCSSVTTSTGQHHWAESALLDSTIRWVLFYIIYILLSTNPTKKTKTNNPV